MIAHYRQRSCWPALVAAILLTAIVLVGLTDAVEKPAGLSTSVGAAVVSKETKTQEKTQESAKQTSKPPATNRTMRIQVLGPNGKPMAGAKIQVSVWTKEPFQANQRYVCDDQGKTTTRLPQTIDILRVWARKENHPPLFAQWWPEKQRDGHRIPEEYTFRLQNGTQIGGVVQDENGRPIEGVKVEVQRVSHEGFEKGLKQRPRLGIWLAEDDQARTTDARGRWTLSNVPAGDQIDVRVKLSHPDYIDDATWGSLQREQGVTMAALRAKTATLVMWRGVQLTGTISDPNGKPVRGALVIWGDDPYFQSGSQEIRTDPMGFYRLPPLPRGSTHVTVVGKGWAPQMRMVEISRKQSVADFRLSRGKKLTVRIVDPAGDAIPFAYVGIHGWKGVKSLYNHKHPNVLDTKIPRKADKNGVYKWTWAPEGPVQYVFGKEGRQYREQAVAAGGPPVTVTLAPQVMISGTVTDAETGQPIPSFRITPVRGPKQPIARIPPSMVEGRGGKYRYAFDEPASQVYVVIWADGYRPMASPLFSTKKQSITFDAKLKKDAASKKSRTRKRETVNDE